MNNASLNKTTFIAGYIVRTDRNLSTLGSNGNGNYGNTNFRRTVDKRFFFKPKLKFASDTKRLIWDELSPTMTIYPKDEGELCHIVFSDTNFQNSPYAAMVSTEQSEKNPIISAQYGIAKGSYKIRITITAENEASISKSFHLVVKDNDFDLEEID